ncbi:hypothetical protein VDQ94_05520 [Xanthomonas campestris pv. campestris]|nr:hypothetical protein [Xanthomonas campestris pv. campestris]MEB1551735.1 hypothetical protein [Xanthomonas campestris pv. campestris]
MWLRQLLGLSPSPRDALESAFDPVQMPVKRPHSSVSRAFAASPKRQAGGAPMRRSGLSVRWAMCGIVPISGVKVP